MQLCLQSPRDCLADQLQLMQAYRDSHQGCRFEAWWLRSFPSPDSKQCQSQVHRLAGRPCPADVHGHRWSVWPPLHLMSASWWFQRQALDGFVTGPTHGDARPLLGIHRSLRCHHHRSGFGACFLFGVRMDIDNVCRGRGGWGLRASPFQETGLCACHWLGYCMHALVCSCVVRRLLHCRVFMTMMVRGQPLAGPTGL